MLQVMMGLMDLFTIGRNSAHTDGLLIIDKQGAIQTTAGQGINQCIKHMHN
jgi:hypothetical protein